MFYEIVKWNCLLDTSLCNFNKNYIVILYFKNCAYVDSSKRYKIHTEKKERERHPVAHTHTHKTQHTHTHRAA